MGANGAQASRSIPEVGRKQDSQKARWDLFPWKPVAWVMGQRVDVRHDPPNPVWFVNPATGDDNQNGESATTALKTFTEMRHDLVPASAMDEVARVLAFGARKYSPGNWAHVPDARRRYFAAAIRHLIAWWLGEKKDNETGVSHLAHSICCGLFLLSFETTKVPSK
jgi:hypothetical protein